MILIDLSQIVMSGIMVHLANELKRPGVEPKSLIKHMIISTLLGFKQRFGAEYGDMVLCADSRHYWRKDHFPWYKGHRKHAREKSDLDFDMIFETIDEMKSELKDVFPWKLIEVDGAEADDVISTLVVWLSENDLKQQGVLISEPQPTLIISSDGDFGQLQRFPFVSQWNPQHKKWIKVGNPHNFLVEHICEGDGGDNVPNILTSDQWAKDRANNEDTKVRQTPFRKARFEAFYEHGVDACQNESERINWSRNKTLVDLTCIPKTLYDKIVDTYITYEKKSSKTKIMGYLVQNKMKKLFEQLGAF